MMSRASIQRQLRTRRTLRCAPTLTPSATTKTRPCSSVWSPMSHSPEVSIIILRYIRHLTESLSDSFALKECASTISSVLNFSIFGAERVLKYYVTELANISRTSERLLTQFVFVVVAPVKQLIMEKLPKQARIHQQSKELISTLCMHFLMHLAEQANDFCSAQNKKTVCPDHVLDALVVSRLKYSLRV